ncbi:MAG: sel1 repeat family protein [Puniceicoccales bacterium]|jgi:hypothetical protein|nr:sel1 repeat family protein [Puniceicoccales bacterium]
MNLNLIAVALAVTILPVGNIHAENPSTEIPLETTFRGRDVYKLNLRYESKENEARRLQLLYALVDHGNNQAQYTLGMLYLCHGMEQDGITLLEKAARDNNPLANLALGQYHRDGKFVEKDEEKSFEYFLKAANHGAAPAQYEIGNRYYNGIGVEPDEELALAHFSRAAYRGNVPAQIAAAKIYESRKSTLVACIYLGMAAKLETGAEAQASIKADLARIESQLSPQEIADVNTEVTHRLELAALRRPMFLETPVEIVDFKEKMAQIKKSAERIQAEIKAYKAKET